MTQLWGLAGVDEVSQFVEHTWRNKPAGFREAAFDHAECVEDILDFIREIKQEVCVNG